MNREQKQRLIEALLDCPTMYEPGDRNTVVRELPPHIRDDIHRGASNRVDVTNIVTRCTVCANDLKVLIDQVQSQEGDSVSMGKVREAAEPILATLPELPGPVLPANREQPFNVPSEAPYFVGRRDELVWLEERLTQFQERQILGLWGLGGIGKTSLAVHIACTLRDFFEDGVLWAQLDTTSLEAIWENFARDFGQTEAMAQEPDLPRKAALGRQILADKHVLIVLDNVEDSWQIKHLLPNGPHNVVLITTRNRKALINVGVDPDHILNIPVFDESQGLALLARILKGKEKSEEAAAREAVRLVGGLPLALNIVAGYLAEPDAPPITEYNRLLANEQKRLGKLRDWESGQNVIASFELSYEYLLQTRFDEMPFLQLLFAGLALFDGDFDLEAISALAQVPLDEVQPALSLLQSLSLVGFTSAEGRSVPQGQTKTRYRLHPLLKDFAAYKLKTQFAAQLEALRRNVAMYFINLIHRDRQQDHATLDLDWLNVFGALCWAYEQKHWDILLEGVQGLTAVNLGVFGFLDACGHWREARQLLAYAAEAPEIVSDAFMQANILVKQGAFAVRMADYQNAETYLQSTLAVLADLPLSVPVVELRVYLYDLFRRITQRYDRPAALEWLESGLSELEQLRSEEPQLVPAELRGYLHVHQASLLGQMGRLEEAADALLIGWTALPDGPTPLRFDGLLNLSNILAEHRNFEQGQVILQHSITLAQTLGDLRRQANCWHSLGVTKEEIGQTQEAISCYTEALTLYHRMGDANQESFIRANLGLSYLICGEGTEAAEHLDIAVRLAEQHHLVEAEAFAKINLARLYIRQERWIQADIVLARAHEICVQLDLEELAEALCLQAEVALHSDQANRALALIEEAIQTARANEDSLAEGVSWRVKGKILQVQVQEDAALMAYQTSLNLLEDQDPYEFKQTQAAMLKGKCNENTW